MRKLLAVPVVALLACAPSAFAVPRTTESQTILDRDGDNRLEPAPGDAYETRFDLGTPSANRARTRTRLIFFGQMTDTHVVDEESPLRVEFLDAVGGPFTSAYRPHEGLSAQVLEEMVKQLRNTTSPIPPARPLELVMTTGDNTDNTQRNETRWMIDVMDGDVVVDPNSGIEGTCELPDGERYDGVRGDHRYYEPDASDGEDGSGYSPRDAENERSTEVRDFPGLFEQMNQPFRATGFRDLPWYAVFGNHDGLVQGNQPRNPALEALATGCVKVTGLSAGAIDAIREAAESEDSDEDVRDALVAGLQQAAFDATSPDTTTTTVPLDPQRRPLRKTEWIAEHFETTGVPVGHGFANNPAAAAEGMGYYDFSPKPGLRFITLDTVAELGLEEGNIDDRQFQWLHTKLLEAEGAGEYVMLFAHHGIGTLGQPNFSPFPPGDQGGDLGPIVHFGDGPRNTGTSEPCTETSPIEPPAQTETLRCLLLRHPGVIAFVNGHEHNNRVDSFTRRPGDGPVEGGFWEVNTASHIDWPQQSRVIDLFDNHDGTLSIFGTIVDHGGPAEPGGPDAPRSGQGRAPDQPQRLASISRELSFNDPHANHDDTDGSGGGRGGEGDRNVELGIRDPYAAP
jgi:metallophosphoesterase (TIGR03767 family)